VWPFRGASAGLGPRGERLAMRHLRQGGLKILARNYRCPAGEIDLIALDRSSRAESGAETLVFVEVKTRASDRYTDPSAAVDADKRRRVERAASHYLAERGGGGFNVRFDIVSIVAAPGERPRIEHIPQAF